MNILKFSIILLLPFIVYVSAYTETTTIKSGQQISYDLYPDSNYLISVDVLSGIYAQVSIYNGESLVLSGNYVELQQHITTYNNHGYLNITNNHIFENIDVYIIVNNVNYSAGLLITSIIVISCMVLCFLAYCCNCIFRIYKNKNNDKDNNDHTYDIENDLYIELHESDHE